MFTLFLPGIEAAPAEGLPRMPALERLLSRARSRPLDGAPWAFLARHAGGDLAGWPVGPVAALADLADAPACCLRAEPLGMDAEQRGQFRLPAGQLAIRADEAHALAAAFSEALGGDGLVLQVGRPDRWYLALPPGLAADPGWRGFDAPALPEGGRPLPPGRALGRLLSELEMLFFAHPVNEARRDRGEPLIAGLHPWGGGCLAAAAPATGALGAAVAERGFPADAEPYLAGLARLGAGGLGSSHSELRAGGVAWPVAVERMGPACLETVEREWAVPLLSALQRGRLGGLRIVSGERLYELGPLDAWKAWRRVQPLGELA